MDSWPCATSPVLASISFPVPVKTLLDWLKIRDLLFGHNHVNQDISQALSLASSCMHPDAQWLHQVFRGQPANKGGS